MKNTSIIHARQTNLVVSAVVAHYILNLERAQMGVPFMTLSGLFCDSHARANFSQYRTDSRVKTDWIEVEAAARGVIQKILEDRPELANKLAALRAAHKAKHDAEARKTA